MNAVFICTSCSEEQIDRAREIVEERSPDFPIGITALDDILVLRALGNNTKQLQGLIIPIWNMLRPIILNRKPIKPRIWAT